MSEELKPEYADITPEMMEDARKAGERIIELTQQGQQQDAESVKKIVAAHQRSGNQGRLMDISVPPQAIRGNARSQATREGHNVEVHDKVSGMIDEANEMNRLHKVIGSGGKEGSSGIDRSRDYEPGSSKRAESEDSVSGRRWDLQNVSEYSVKNGVAKKTSAKPNAPQTYTGETHVFAPEHQERAKDLIQSLADKQGVKRVEKSRHREVEKAKERLSQINNREDVIDKAA